VKIFILSFGSLGGSNPAIPRDQTEKEFFFVFCPPLKKGIKPISEKLFLCVKVT
jgi:hypothetical protein